MVWLVKGSEEGGSCCPSRWRHHRYGCSVCCCTVRFNLKPHMFAYELVLQSALRLGNVDEIEDVLEKVRPSCVCACMCRGLATQGPFAPLACCVLGCPLVPGENAAPLLQGPRPVPDA